MRILNWVNCLHDTGLACSNASLHDVSRWFDIIRQHPESHQRIVGAGGHPLFEVLVVWEGSADLSDEELMAAWNRENTER